MKWKQGDILLHKLTGECVMILEALPRDGTTFGQLGGYIVRRQKDWTHYRVGEFELEERQI